MGKKTKRVVTFGEVMMRLSPPGYAKFSQATSLDIDYGGGEANVAIALAYMGVDASHVTRLPDNLVGRSATQYLRQHWIDTNHILYGDSRMGLYFLEKGAPQKTLKAHFERPRKGASRRLAYNSVGEKNTQKLPEIGLSPVPTFLPF